MKVKCNFIKALSEKWPKFIWGIILLQQYTIRIYKLIPKRRKDLFVTKSNYRNQFSNFPKPKQRNHRMCILDFCTKQALTNGIRALKVDWFQSRLILARKVLYTSYNYNYSFVLLEDMKVSSTFGKPLSIIQTSL